MTRPRIYLDHNATTPIRPEVVAVIEAELRTNPGNASTPYTEGRAARQVLNQARLAIADALGAERDEILFTASGTEANQIALLGALLASRRAGKDHIVVSAIEHPSILAFLRESPLRELWRVSVAPVRANGTVDVGDVLALVRRETGLVALMAVNNELGSIQPVGELATALAVEGIPVLCDAVQAAGKIPLDLHRLPVAMLTLAAHKVGGPHGIGALFLRAGTPFAPAHAGGHQELGKRPGTEAVALAAGFAKALTMSCNEREFESARLERLRVRLRDTLRTLDDWFEHGADAERVANTISLALPGVDAMALVAALDLDGFAVSTGSACATGAQLPSHVLVAIGREDVARSSLRISLGRTTSEDDIVAFTRALITRANAMRRARTTSVNRLG
jgi:cysteine desulfurase